jgi:nicotinamide mononucleotide transporter
MSWTEVAGFATGALCVWLIVKQKAWNFPVGIANNVFFIVLFSQAGLYADAGLQVIYIGLALVGWYWWLSGGAGRGRLAVRSTPRGAWLAIGLGIAVGTAVLGWVLSTWTNSTVAGWDALTTVMSLAAQLMLNRKWLGNWLVWIAADVIYIALYLSKGLWLTSVLYAVFPVMCLFGLREWRASLRAAPTAVAIPTIVPSIEEVTGA